MPKSHKAYPPEFKRRLVEMVRAGRHPEELAEKFEPTAQSIRKGVSLPALQKVLGHDHLTTTQIYLNMSPEDVLREYEDKW